MAVIEEAITATLPGAMPNFAPGPVLKDKPQSKLYLPWRSALGQPGNSSHIGSDRRGIRINREVRVCRRVPVDNVECTSAHEH